MKALSQTHPLTLVFRDKTLEARFRETMKERSLAVLRFATLMAIATWVTFWITDWLYAPEKAWISAGWRFGVFIPLYIIERLCTFHPKLKQYPNAISIGGLLHGLIGVFVVSHAMESSAVVVGAYILLLLFFLFVFSGLLFVQVVWVSLIVLAASVWYFHFLMKISNNEIFFLVSILGCTEVVGALALYMIENYQRLHFINEIQISEEKALSEALLLNALPQTIVDELKENGEVKPKYHGVSSVLFADFEGFTRVAERLSPRELVDDLNDYFSEFDLITSRYRLEKLKTIGDCYMCAGGVPVEHPEHAANIVSAGLEMLDYVKQKNKERSALNKPVWDIRVGIHAGPLVAGVIGKKKFAYDIWGDTVNVASRAESNGVPGRICVTGDMYQLIRDRFRCTYRGKVAMKNHGDMDMYLVDEALPVS